SETVHGEGVQCGFIGEQRRVQGGALAASGSNEAEQLQPSSSLSFRLFISEEEEIEGEGGGEGVMQFWGTVDSQ
ncbi:hypothetical protein PanWU01x14_335290, partial [Parasponia andersonii]